MTERTVGEWKVIQHELDQLDIGAGDRIWEKISYGVLGAVSDESTLTISTTSTELSLIEQIEAELKEQS